MTKNSSFRRRVGRRSFRSRPRCNRQAGRARRQRNATTDATRWTPGKIRPGSDHVSIETTSADARRNARLTTTANNRERAALQRLTQGVP
jgi:hypothetical protein